MARLAVIEPTKTWTIVKNPYGDEPENQGYAVGCFDPVTDEHTIESDVYPQRHQAETFLELHLA